MNKIISFLALAVLLMAQIRMGPMEPMEPMKPMEPMEPMDPMEPIRPTISPGPTQQQQQPPSDFQAENLPQQPKTWAMNLQKSQDAQKSAMDNRIQSQMTDAQALNLLKSGDQSRLMSAFGWPSWWRRCRLCAYIYYQNSNYRLTRWWNNQLFWTTSSGWSSNQLWTLQQLGYSGAYRISNNGLYITQTGFPWNPISGTNSPWGSSSYWYLEGETSGNQQLTYVRNLGYWNSYWRATWNGLYAIPKPWGHPFRFVFYPCKRRYN